MKKVLIISYYWPPAGGGGVMRWLKMSHYIAQDSDWTPIIFKPQGANYLIQDDSLESQVQDITTIECPIWEPNNILLKLGFKSVLKQVASGGIGSGEKKPSMFKRIMVWVRSNLFIPDARAYWIKPASRYLIKYLESHPVDAIVSTGPPHSLHLIANAVKKETGVKWIADYRDPWTFIDFFEDLNLSERSFKKHHDLEKEVMKNADAVVTVSQQWAERLKELYSRPIELINNGFDPRDFEGLGDEQLQEFTITHIGSLNKDRNPVVLWSALSEMKKQHLQLFKRLKIRIIGTISAEVVDSVKTFELEEMVSLEPYMPHAEVIKVLKASHVSLLLINDTSNKGGIIPGKLYEYLAIGNPILAIGNNEGDSAGIIKECQAGKVFGYDEVLALKNHLVHMMENQGGMKHEILKDKIEQYSRRYLAKKYTILLDKLTS